MKKGNVCVGIAIAIAMTAVLMVSGCVEDITSDKYEFAIRVSEEKGIGDGYAIELLEAQYHGENDSEALVEIFGNIGGIGGRISMSKRVLKIGETVVIEKLTLQLVEVNRRERYADFTAKISNTEIDIAPALEAGETIKKVAEGAIKSATSS